MTALRLTVRELEAICRDLDPEGLRRMLTLLEGDERKTARALRRRLMRALMAEEERREAYLKREALVRQLAEEGYGKVAGVDEAGRGPLAGPLVAAAVILPPDSEFPELDDSKRLSEESREELYRAITTAAVAWSVSCVNARVIDRVNVHNAALLAMQRAVARLRPVPDFVLVDGPFAPDFGVPARAIVGGDRLCNPIAAASIIAKVVRDRLMQRLDRRYPGYGFARHKGYPTAEHKAALRRLGPCPLHRLSFKGCALS